MRCPAGGIHLHGPTRAAVNDRTGVSSGYFQGFICATAIADNNFTPLCYLRYREQFSEALIETGCFVQHRNYDAELGIIRQGLRHNCYPGPRYSRNSDRQF